MEDSTKLRLVRCPKCQNVLPELANYTVYQCGGCNTVLRGKPKGSEGGGRLWQASDEEQGGGDQDASGSFLRKGVVDLSDNSDVDVRSSGGSSREGQRRDLKKSNKGHERFLDDSRDGDEKGVLEDGFNVNKDKRGKSIGREQQEQKTHMGGDQFYGRMSNLPIGERGEMEGFWRKPQADMEDVRFATLNYPDEGSSNSYSSFSYNYGEQWRNYKDMDGVSRVQHLEQDRAEILRKLDELSNQLNKSCEVVSNPKEKVLPEGKMVPPDPFSGPETRFPDGSSAMNRSSRQFFGPTSNKHMAGSPYFNYQDPYAYRSGHEMAMHNFYPSMHNPNYVPGYGDPFVSEMMRGSHPLPRQFPQQPMHPYFPGRYTDTGPDSYDACAQNAMLHPPSCPCFRCYDNKRRGPVPAPAAFGNSRFPHTPNDSMLYRHEIPGAVGPHVHNARTAIPAVSLHEKQLHTRWPRDYNSEMGGFVGSRPRKVVPGSGGRHCLPIAGGSPFITCHICYELLQLPKKTLVMVKNCQQKMRCGACSSEIKFAVIDKKLVFSPHSQTEETTTSTRVDDATNEVVNSRVFHARGDVNTGAANFSSDDYSGYDFHSVDRESPVLAADPSLNSTKSRERQSFHSSSPSTSNDENSSEVMAAPSEALKSIHQPTKASQSSPGGSFNNAVNRLGKGNQSSRSDQETEKIEKNASRQNSLKELVLATEMDVIDYSNNGISQDLGDASGEHDHPRSSKRGESFLANIIKKDNEKNNVTVNGQPISDCMIKKAEKLAGPIQPGNYWYDSRAGFWGVMGGPCLGIILPFIEEFRHPMPDKCAGGNTGVYVNGRELHQKDLDLLSRRGLPRDSNRYYIVEISGRVQDEDTGEDLDSLGKLAPTVEKERRGFGMKVPRAAA
ncbi:hypothetical protein AAZX31_16G025100 [Glycine max]|uniref:Uncharacterized protein n=3 Tax=Glycine subgen. Soja TaxID=1462606 RepID=I1MKL5_SOYBN|nr:protein ENHANCED DISEASE RESISTANCE 4 [Glycine max]XP_028208050.1 protein ENHANCED DISEASE RESISTANCE 4-like [Glycine soja]KAG4938073.1 hypothetical protein JHK86_044214 [Glycine max]KAG5100831.1 hypothetical protein JHK82_045883 [Glycine max]KAG5107415.1 hypothetical protein JHK84_044322 [Glycine max]KAH1149662.1 hypothetical protein GYH30_043943 [Glycine max]KAH1204667.1 Extra-large guanine nucleotide-binding protein 1 [Glycine max]|eukprot:XP_003548495.2 protein ENHANCED DISEASE RESISTANCE 4 [Glycine max]